VVSSVPLVGSSVVLVVLGVVCVVPAVTVPVLLPQSISGAVSLEHSCSSVVVLVVVTNVLVVILGGSGAAQFLLPQDANLLGPESSSLHVRSGLPLEDTHPLSVQVHPPLSGQSANPESLPSLQVPCTAFLSAHPFAFPAIFGCRQLEDNHREEHAK